MPRERTAEEDVPVTKRISRMFGGRGKDVQLPMGARGKRDPRLPRDTAGEIAEGYKRVRELARPANGRGKRSNGRSR